MTEIPQVIYTNITFLQKTLKSSEWFTKQGPSQNILKNSIPVWAHKKIAQKSSWLKIV